MNMLIQQEVILDSELFRIIWELNQPETEEPEEQNKTLSKNLNQLYIN